MKERFSMGWRFMPQSQWKCSMVLQEIFGDALGGKSSFASLVGSRSLVGLFLKVVQFVYISVCVGKPQAADLMCRCY
ncbi:hypothetical protein TIFTF001_000819 [Ficus carica]|uniref:Uncharacterized protein n=1 Tax=Ficus carica TaxID=3494 RepID=A0AA87ZF24_FICCA|nr:hypothetical protein TIFTF001_000819 [Ficus carica]